MRLLILNTSCCWRKSNDPFVYLGKRLAERGVEVHHIVGGGEDCSFYGTLPDWTDERCISTQERVTGWIQDGGNPVSNLRSFETPAMQARVDEWWETARNQPAWERVYKGFRVRDLIRGSLARHLFGPIHPDPRFEGGEEQSGAQAQQIARRMARAAALGIEIAEAALRQIRPDCILLFNGYFYMEWIFAETARRMGIRAVAHEASCFADRMFFDPAGVIGNRHTLSGATINHRLDACELSPARRSRLEGYLNDIWQGKVNTIAQAEPEDPEELRRRLNLPRDKRLILLIGQVSYDTVVIYDSGTFPTSLDFLRSGIEAVGQIPDAHLVIRLHPHEMAVNNNWTLRQIEKWDLPPWVTVVHSRQANTYQLMEMADCGLTMTSQAGLEMIARKKPVVITGRAFYGGKGFTTDVNRPDELLPALEHALALGGQLNPEQYRRLELFLDYLIFDYLVPFDTEHDRFSSEAVDRILAVLDPSGCRQYEQAAGPGDRMVRLEVNGDFATDLKGWKAHGSRIERVPVEGEAGECSLLVSTDPGAWSGVLYGCEKTNVCDSQTLEAHAGAEHTVSVQVRGKAGDAGIPIQLHLVGSPEKNFGTAKKILTDEWQNLTFTFTAAADTRHLGVQIVKANHAEPIAFQIRELKVTARQTSAPGAPAVISANGALPRLLLINEVPFGNHTGYGVTITNLFRGWPRERLAEIYRMIDYEPDMSVGMYHLPLFDTSRDPEGRELGEGLKKVKYPLQLRAGMFDVHEHDVNIRRALKWVKPFRPDVIFTSPVTYATSRFAVEMSRKLGIPYVTHIMDDWLAHWEAGIRPANADEREPARQLKRNELTRRLFAGASERQVISRMMADSYQQRYGHRFEVVHNAIDLAHWDLGPRDYERQGPFRILYTGAIWWNIQMPTLRIFGEVIDELANQGHNIRLEIYTHPNFEKQYAAQIARPPHVEFKGLVPYEKMPRLMREADALLVPVTFDEDLLVYARYSMPTKVPEYMISGTPVILYGPPDAAPVDYALREQWGYPITEPDRENLKQRLIELMNSRQAREAAGRPARLLARKRHDLRTVREDFWAQIQRAAAAAK